MNVFLQLASLVPLLDVSDVVTVISPDDHHPDIYLLMTIEDPTGPGGPNSDDDPMGPIPGFYCALLIIFVLFIVMFACDYHQSNKGSDDPYDYYNIVYKVVQEQIPGD